MATRKKATPAKTQDVFYTVTPEEYPLKKHEDITLFETIEHAFFDAQECYDGDPTEANFIVYEIKRKGVVKLNIDVKIL